MFVIHKDIAIKTPARFGISSFEHYEVIKGLQEGDEIIISDMADFMHMKEVEVR